MRIIYLNIGTSRNKEEDNKTWVEIEDTVTDKKTGEQKWTVVPLDHFKDMLFVMDMNPDGVDVELYYKVYVALRSGKESDYVRAETSLRENHKVIARGGLN